MSRSSDKGQTEPVAALAAVAAVGLTLSLYGGFVGDVLPSSNPDVETTLDIVADDIAPDGVALPDRLDTLTRPADGHLNVSLAVGTERWSIGPTPPARAHSARRRVPVRRGDGTTDAGRIRVVVW